MTACYVFAREVFASLVTPKLLTHALVHTLGESFGEAVGEGFEEDSREVVVRVFKLLHPFLDADTCGDGEAADIVFFAALTWRNIVGEAIIGLSRCFLSLLTQVIKYRSVLQNQLVVFVGVRRPKTNHAFGGQPLFVDNALQHRLRIII